MYDNLNVKCKCLHQSTSHHPTEKEMKRIWGKPNRSGESNFDVYKLLPTVWYCGYRGSITMPPCTNRVVWRFLDLPLHVSKKQLERIQSLIKEQKDEKCKPNRVAFNGKVNRPIQKIDKQEVFCCTSANWKFSRVKDDDSEWKDRMRDWPDNYHVWKKKKISMQ